LKIGGTGYLNDFSDGKTFDPKPSILGGVQSVLAQRFSKRIKVPVPCHSYGMVGFIKELVDEQGLPASRWVTKPVGEDQSSRICLLHRASFSSPKPRPLLPLSQIRFLLVMYWAKQ
jgi:hypothetical protein